MIELKDIKKSFGLGKHVVEAIKGINLNVSKGDFVCIAGKSGSGKTTLLNIIGFLDKQTSGNYKLNDINSNEIKEQNQYKIRKDYIGFIFQNFSLIPVLSTFENVELPLILENHSKKERQEKVMTSLEEVGLGDRKDHLPDELSGGERQRAAIARALVKRPPIILADEPTANLDSDTGNNIIGLMKDLNQENQTTFIFSTHDRDIMNQADNVLYLKDGRLKEQ